MALITWDDVATRLYETGVDHCVLYLYDSLTSKYTNGVAWNGITAITESPSGAEPTALYADNIKYLNLFSAEEFACTIEAYTYPDAFEACDGMADIGGTATGVLAAQQSRALFGLCYRTIEGNDVDGPDYNEKLHLIYGCTASPSEKAYSTVNDSPEAITFSWEVSTVPVAVTGFKPTALLTLDKLLIGDTDWATITDKLYGASTAAELLLPDEIVALLTP